jgi:hypothetical protein
MHTKRLHEGAKKLALVKPDSSKYLLSRDNQVCTVLPKN